MPYKDIELRRASNRTYCKRSRDKKKGDPEFIEKSKRSQKKYRDKIRQDHNRKAREYMRLKRFIDKINGVPVSQSTKDSQKRSHEKLKHTPHYISLHNLHSKIFYRRHSRRVLERVSANYFKKRSAPTQITLIASAQKFNNQTKTE